MGRNLMELVMQAAENVGYLEKNDKGELVASRKGGTLAYLEWIAVHRSERFIALMARVAPKQVFADVTHRDATLTIEEVEAELRDRGIPVEMLHSLLKAPVELDWDEDPDPYNTMKDVTPSGTNGGETPDDTTK
jgi:hypothetical protein